MKVLYQLVMLAGGIGTLAGCGNATAGARPESLVPVKGCVTMDNKPIEGAMVVFSPRSSTTSGDGSIGITDANGNYEATSGGANGAAVGSYKIMISRLTDPTGKPVVATLETPPANLGAVESMPPKYADHAMTTLKCTVAAGGGTFDFKLTSR